MKHPTLAREHVLAHMEELMTGAITELSSLATWEGDGNNVDLTDLNLCIGHIEQSLKARLADGTGGLDDDQFEGSMAGDLHRCLSSWDVGILDDAGFWSYLACGPLWFFTKWREDPAKRKPETYNVYIDGSKNVECVPLRMFLRAQAIGHQGDYALGEAVPQGTDFWRSHILRVRTGSEPRLAREIAKQHATNRMMVDNVREYAKRIRRRWSNEVIYALDPSECAAVARDERP